MTIQMKATEQYFPVVLFIMLYKVVLTFESVDKIANGDISDESFLSSPAVPVLLFIIHYTTSVALLLICCLT